MKTKHLFAASTILSTLFFASIGRAADITAAGSGNWSSTNLDAPWPVGMDGTNVDIPGTNDDVDVESPNDVTVDGIQSIQYIYGGGTITMAAGSTLNVVGDPAGAFGTSSLAVLDTSAPNNTVVYSGNNYWAKHQNYGNLTLDGYGSIYNGDVPMTIAGNLVLGGTRGAGVQQALPFTIAGNLTIGAGCFFDSSVAPVTVYGNTTVSGTLEDLSGGITNLDDDYNNITVNPGGVWSLTDVIEWAVSGSVTNNGSITATKGPGGGGAATFTGTGVITGNPFGLWNIFLNGTNMVTTTITATNFIGLGGTVVFDLANPGKLIVAPTSTNALTYVGAVKVINTGAAPATGTTYQLFSAANYGGTIASVSLPSLPAGLSWIDNLATSGSISVTGSVIGNAPKITATQSGSALTLSWDSISFPGYSVQAQTNTNGIGTNWAATGTGTNSPVMFQIKPTNPQVFFRLVHP